MSDSVVAPSPSNVIALGVVWPLLCAVVVALRFYTRRVQGARLLLDDWLTIPALVRVVRPAAYKGPGLMTLLALDLDIWVGWYPDLR